MINMEMEMETKTDFAQGETHHRAHETRTAENMVWVFIIAVIILLSVSSVVWAGSHDPWDGTLWDTASPDIDQPIGNSYKEIYDLRKGVGLRMVKEHVAFATSSAGGQHKQGSARGFFQASEPLVDLESNLFGNEDRGSFWVDSDDNALYVLTASLPTWTPISTEVISTMLGQSSRTWTGTSTFQGACTFNNSINPTSYSTGNGGFLDEDDMASDSATKVASQQSIKAYVANAVIANTAAATSSTTTVGTTLTDLSASTETITVEGSSVLVMFTVSAKHSTNGKIEFTIDRDGTDLESFPFDCSGQTETHTIQYLDESPASGSSTYKIEWQQFNVGETGTAYGRYLTLLDIK